MIKKFNQFINENESTHINWEEIEELCANTPDLPDCVPQNVRQWDTLIKQYERACDLVNGKWEPHYNWKTRADFEQAVDEQFYLGKGYKHSIYECWEDAIPEEDLFKNVNWDIIRTASSFTKWDVDISYVIRHLDKLPILPKTVGGDFDCSVSKLVTLEGCPKYVGGHFFCSKNKLTSLKGAPNYVGGHFYCSTNELPSSIPSQFFGKDLHKYIDL